MKKYWLFLIIGVLFVFGGVFLYSRNSDNPIGSVNEKTLSRNDAIGIVNGLVQNAIKVY